MKMEIQSVKFDADTKLQDFIKEKLEKLNRFAEDIISADVILKLEKDHEHGNKVANINLNVVGGSLVAERRCKSFEEAVDQSLDALKKQIEKHKEKHK